MRHGYRVVAASELDHERERNGGETAHGGADLRARAFSPAVNSVAENGNKTWSDTCKPSTGCHPTRTQACHTTEG